VVSCCTSSHRCTKDSNVLCYIWPVCSEIWNKKTRELKEAYKLYFGYKFCDHNKNCGSHICCPPCVVDRKDWHNARHTDSSTVHCLKETEQHLWPILLKDCFLRSPHIKTNAVSITVSAISFQTGATKWPDTCSCTWNFGSHTELHVDSGEMEGCHVDTDRESKIWNSEKKTPFNILG